MRLDLTFTMGDIYINSNLWTHSKKSVAAVEAPSLKIFSNNHKECLNQHKNSYSCAMKRGIPFQFKGKSVETETTP